MRPRKKDRNLPSCVYLRSGSYYYVKKGKWTMIGKTLGEALREYSRRQTVCTDKMPALLERYMDTQTRLAQKTKNAYGTGKNHLSKALVDFYPHQITVRDLLEIQHHMKDHPGTWNIMRTVLIGALDLAIVEGTVDRNVARDTKRLKTVARDRYLTDDEFNAIYNKASPLIQVIMDLLYLTGQRIGDILAIKYSDITDDGLYVQQGKTKTRMILAWDKDLKTTVQKARAMHKSVKAMTFLIHKRNGEPYPYDYILKHWQKTCKLAEVADANIHDIRAKAGTDAHKAGMDSKALLGHKSEATHQRYLRNKEIPIVQALSFRKRS